MWSHLILKDEKTPLMYAARNAQSPAAVDVLLRNKADVYAMDKVSGWDRDGVGCHIYGYPYGVTGRWGIVGCSL